MLCLGFILFSYRYDIFGKCLFALIVFQVLLSQFQLNASIFKITKWNMFGIQLRFAFVEAYKSWYVLQWVKIFSHIFWNQLISHLPFFLWVNFRLLSGSHPMKSNNYYKRQKRKHFKMNKNFYSKGIFFRVAIWL